MSGIAVVENPYDGSFLDTVDTQDIDALKQQLVIASDLYQRRSGWLSVADRIAVLRRAQRLMEDAKSELALLIAREGGKPLKDAEVEVARAIAGVGLCAEHIRADVGRRVPIGTDRLTAGRLAYTVKEPIGIVAAVSAFNHPLNLIVHQVAPAVAAGCPVIIKPAADTPLSCLRFVELLQQAGLPPGWCQSLVTTDLQVAEALVTDPRLGFFSFIGSSRVGWTLRSKLAPGVRCALEHGGAAPVIVCTDADLEMVVQAVVKGGFYHAGQVCVSVQRVFVPASRRAAFIDRLQEVTRDLVVGDPTDPSTDVGPLIRKSEVDRVVEWVDEAVVAGATCVIGGVRQSARAYSPTVLVNPPDDARVSTQEIFGPVVCVYDYEREEDAVVRANALPVAFQAAVFTASIDAAVRIGRRLAGSAIMVNDHTAFRDDVMPFAGLRQSGLGVGGISYTLEDMQIDKMIVLRSSEL